MMNMENPPIFSREQFKKEQREFYEKYSVPLESLIPEINTDGLTEERYENGERMYKREFIESQRESEERGAGIHADTSYAYFVIQAAQHEKEKAFLDKIKDTVVVDLGSGSGREP